MKVINSQCPATKKQRNDVGRRCRLNNDKQLIVHNYFFLAGEYVSSEYDSGNLKVIILGDVSLFVKIAPKGSAKIINV